MCTYFYQLKYIFSFFTLQKNHAPLLLNLSPYCNPAACSLGLAIRHGTANRSLQFFYKGKKQKIYFQLVETDAQLSIRFLIYCSFILLILNCYFFCMNILQITICYSVIRKVLHVSQIKLLFLHYLLTIRLTYINCLTSFEPSHGLRGCVFNKGKRKTEIKIQESFVCQYVSIGRYYVAGSIDVRSIHIRSRVIGSICVGMALAPRHSSDLVILPWCRHRVTDRAVTF